MPTNEGRPLDAATAAYFGMRFGRDFGHVRVHDDPDAARVSESYGARALTAGDHIYFGTGELAPGTSRSDRLLAHELTHVVQQDDGDASAGSSIHRDRIGSAAGDAARRTEYPWVGHVSAYWSAALRATSSKRADDPHAGTLADLPRGTEVLVTGRDRGWLRVTTTIEGRERIGYVSHELIAYDRPGPAAVEAAAKAKRIAELDVKYQTALAAQDWAAAAVALNAFEEAEIAKRVKLLSLSQLAAVKAGALAAMPGSADRVVKPIVARQAAEARTIRATEGKSLSHLERLATKAASETDGADFQKAVTQFKKQLQIDLEAVPAGAPLPPDLQIVIQALLLWDIDKGDQWGEGVWDSKDFTPSAGDYAVVPASQSKCNAFLAEVLYKAVGQVQHGHLAGKKTAADPRAWFPFKAKEWGNSSFTIPHFPIIATPVRGDILCTGTHVGVYLGSYAGKDLYISARDDKHGVFGIGEQFEHGIQIKYTAAGIYRRYTP